VHGLNPATAHIKTLILRPKVVKILWKCTIALDTAAVEFIVRLVLYVCFLLIIVTVQLIA